VLKKIPDEGKTDRSMEKGRSVEKKEGEKTEKKVLTLQGEALRKKVHLLCNRNV